MRKNTNKKRTFKLFFRGFQAAATMEPWLMPVTFMVAIADALFPFISLYFSAKLLNELTSKTPDKNRMLTYAVLTLVLSLFCKLIVDLLNQLTDVLLYRMQHKRNLNITEKCCKFDYTDMEDPTLREKKERSMGYNYSRGILATQGQFRAFLQSLITIILAFSMVAEMFRLKAEGVSGLAISLNSPYFLIAFAIVYLIIIYYSLKGSSNLQKKNFQVDTETETNYNHIFYYTLRKCVNYQHGKDLRLYNQKGFIEQCIRKQFAEIEEKWSVMPKMEEKLEVNRTILNQGFTMLIYLFVGLKALYGAFGVGNILMYVNAISRLNEGIFYLTYGINSMIRNTDYLADYFDFIDRPNFKMDGTKKISDEIKENYEIEFKNVSFHYPGSTTNSLDHINCTLHSNEKLAVVGRNGSGKSTFIKLLCRLYDPQEGEILLNGTNIKEYDYDDYLDFFSVVFQDFTIFSFTLGENVGSGSDYDAAQVTDSLVKAGFEERLKSLPDGITTQLYNDFAEVGVEISGGEAQKIAIARALYKNSPYVILDEPTAALDPLAEADIYKRLNNFIQNKGAIYISHRLSSCYFCDRISVFDNGKLVEQGTHNELLDKQDGNYYKMWNAQAQYYR